MKEIDDILQSTQSESEKISALVELCEVVSSQYDAERLSLAADALRSYATEIHDEHAVRWSELFRTFCYMYRFQFENALQELERLLPEFEEADDKRGVTRIIMNMGRVYTVHRKDYLNAKKYLEQALKSERDAHNAAGVARVLINMASVYAQLGMYREYMQLCTAELHWLDTDESRFGYGHLLNHLALMKMVHSSDFQGAMELSVKAREVWQQYGDRAFESQALDNIGTAYWYQGEAAPAIEYLMEAVYAAEESGRPLFVADRLTNAALAYMLVDDFEKVLEMNLRAKEIFIDNDAESNSGWAEMGIGQALLGLGQAAKALEHNLRSVQILGEADDIHGTGYAYYRCGEALLALGRVDEAYENFQKSLQKRRHSNAALEISDVQCQRAQLLLAQGYSIEAFEALQEALSVAEAIGARKQIYAAHRVLSDWYAAEGDYKQSNIHLNKYVSIRDEVLHHANIKKIAGLEFLHQKDLQRKEQEATERILNNVLPLSISQRLKEGHNIIADSLPMVSVLFVDVVDFTPLAARLQAEELVQLLAHVFNHFDTICVKHGIEKIKTIGDAYMAVAGAPEACDDHAVRCARVALEMLQDFAIPRSVVSSDVGDIELDFRIGLHCGPVVAGVIGQKKFAYDLWGDTVNLASRMESTGESGRIHCSAEFAAELQLHSNDFVLEERGPINVKGKGQIQSYFLSKKSLAKVN